MLCARGFISINEYAPCVPDAHDYRREHGLEPGEVVLLSSSPGNLMSRLTAHYGARRMASVRATRVVGWCTLNYSFDP